MKDSLRQRIKHHRKAKGLTQEQLAIASEVPYTTLTKIEGGKIKNPSLEVMSKIALALGCSLDDFARVDAFRGPESVRYIWKDILEVMQPGETMLITGIDESKFSEVSDNGLKNFINEIKKKGLKQKLLSCEGDKVRLKEEHLEYRWIPKKYFSSVPVYAYSDRVAMLTWEEPEQAIIMREERLASTFKKNFMFMWDNAIKFKK